jgi:lysophospholipase L1-like esterase
MRSRTVLACAALALVLAPLGAEGLIRLRAHAKYGRYLDIYDLHHRLPETNLLVPLANLDVEFGAGTRVQTDEHGFRSSPVAVPKPARTLRLAFLGASTTFCSQVASNARTWPALVRDGLQERWPALAVECVNAGVTSYTILDSLQNLEQRVAAVEPDVIVIYDAANDLAVDTHALAEAAGLAEPARVPSWLERTSLLWRLIRKNRDFLAAQREGRGAGTKLRCDMEALAAGFEERLVRLVARAQQSAELVVLVTFATRFAREQPREVQLANMEQSFTFMAYLAPEDLLAGFEAYDRAIARAAARTGALLIDELDALQGREEFFADSVHFSEAGCVAMAQRLVRGLTAAQAFTTLAAAIAAAGGDAR